MHYKLPKDILCERCILQMYHQSAPKTPGSYPEGTWNCADIRIVPKKVGAFYESLPVILGFGVTVGFLCIGILGLIRNGIHCMKKKDELSMSSSGRISWSSDELDVIRREGLSNLYNYLNSTRRV